MSIRSPKCSADAARELLDAFNGPDNAARTHGADARPSKCLLSNPNPSPSFLTVATPAPGVYDFEREYGYDRPPPGSPQSFSSTTFQNNFGNFNGFVPAVAPSSPTFTTPSFFRRAVGALLPSYYVRVPTNALPPAPVGSGTENDGVFANVSAKPQPTGARVVQNPDGSVFVVPENTQKDIPPSYADAQADAVPPYWETTVHLPPTTDLAGNMIIEDLPTGSFWLFFSSLFVSFFFQFIGFVFTYLLHTTHAAKYGSRAGLGLTLIQFGFSSRSIIAELGDANSTGDASNETSTESSNALVAAKDWLAILFMALGSFLFISSTIGYYRVKRWERSMRTLSTLPTAENIEHTIQLHRNIVRAFDLPLGNNNRPTAHITELREVCEADVTLSRNLRAAGLL